MIAKLSFLGGALLCAGFFVFFRSWRGISIAEIRLLTGINLLIWGAYFLQASDVQNLRGRLEALEKRISKSSA